MPIKILNQKKKIATARTGLMYTLSNWGQKEKNFNCKNWPYVHTL